MVNSLKKGKKGENEACDWLSKYLYGNKLHLTRNFNQMFIGADIVAQPFIIEVKRREILALDKWWIQITTVERRMKEFDKEYIPIVMFRQNHRDWEFLISATAIGCTNGYVRLNGTRFVEWAHRYKV